jgi:CRP-like cAMP-binding protein
MTIKIFDNSSDFQNFKAGETIFTEGDEGKMMYIIKQGEVEISVRGMVVETVKTGGIIGEMALIDPGPRSATTTAATDCQLVPINEQRFLFMVQQTPYFSLEVMKVMGNRLRNMNRLI